MSNINDFLAGGVKSVQRGIATSAGTVTITSVTVGKTVVHSVSKGSAGTVAASGTVAATTGTYTGTIQLISGGYAVGTAEGYNARGIENGTTTVAAAPITGGTTDLFTKQYSAYLANSTTLTVDGPCEWQVVEYY